MTHAKDAQHLSFEQAQANVHELNESWASVELVQVGGWTQGPAWFVAVDACRAEALASVRWRKSGGDGCWYALHPRTDKSLHRLLMGSPDEFVDHANGNTLDNRSINLRLATPLQSSHNRGKTAGCTSRFKGVYRNRRGYWVAEIVVEGERLYLGVFADEEVAAWAYDEAARKHFGRYARVNHVARPVIDRTPRKPRYSAEVRLAALALAEEVGVPTAARELGVTAGALNYWRRQDNIERIGESLS